MQADMIDVSEVYVCNKTSNQNAQPYMNKKIKSVQQMLPHCLRIAWD